ncbi:hypothetical protein [Peptoniphilus stercorisuis]|uniref:Uncharacterized protein n=1 Tax=Peptoniphilus stercorisuis TaxID=1436965 RepID=A0ABS4KBN5_9FIRM|nr:hypothetical protein [Peptoniphilus stercorisuis]MBP2024586.1 hypothetical protein [Peptoniphilus stercorisuis]
MINKDFNKSLENYYDFMIEDYVKLFKQVILFSDGSYLEDFRSDLNKYAKKLFVSTDFKREYYNFINLNIESEIELEQLALKTIGRIDPLERERFVIFVNKLYFSIAEEAFKNNNFNKDLLISLEKRNLLNNNNMNLVVKDFFGNMPILGQMSSIFKILYSNLIILMGVYILSFGNIKYAHSKNSNKCHSLDCRFIKNVKYVNLRIVLEENLKDFDNCKTCLGK